MESIVHICKRSEWEAAQRAGQYEAGSLLTEGFIHCSRPHQVIEVANRYFLGTQNLILLWIDPLKLSSELRWEASDGDVYPHLYGPLNLDAVTAVLNFASGSDGKFGDLTSFA